MGFFSKITRGIKKVFKKIGKGIKKVAGKVGKFMDKIGIVGQIAMAFILPGIGAALGNTLGSLGAWASTAGGNALVQGAKAVVGAATKFVSTGARVFSTVTDGIKNFVGEIGKTALNKIPGINVTGASQNFFGADGAFGKAAGATADTWNTTIGSPDWMKQFDPVSASTDPITASELGLERPQADVIGPETYQDYMDTTGPYRAAPEGIPTINAQQPMTPPALPEFSVEGPSLLTAPDMPMPVTDVGKPKGFTFTGEEVVSTMGNMAIAGAESMLAPDYSDDYSGNYPGRVEMQDTYAVQEASPIQQFTPLSPTGYGANQVAYDSIVRPTRAWEQTMGGLINVVPMFVGRYT